MWGNKERVVANALQLSPGDKQSAVEALMCLDPKAAVQRQRIGV
jgi:hypothetical protein